MTHDLERGAIHWVELDKRRPALLISPTLRNQLASDVMVIPISASSRRMSWHVRLGRGEGGLAAESMAKCEQLVTVPKGLIEPRPLGPALSPARMREVERALMRAVGIL